MKDLIDRFGKYLWQEEVLPMWHATSGCLFFFVYLAIAGALAICGSFWGIIIALFLGTCLLAIRRFLIRKEGLPTLSLGHFVAATCILIIVAVGSISVLYFVGKPGLYGVENCIFLWAIGIFSFLIAYLW
jgi:hypothetical protein